MKDALALFQDQYRLAVFAPSNPVYFLTLAGEGLPAKEKERLEEAFRFGPVYGNREVLAPLFSRAGIEMPTRIRPHRHVFAAWMDDFETAMLVPFEFERADDWHVNGAFASFAANQTEWDPYVGLLALLHSIESAWSVREKETPLPLRWRLAYHIDVGSPIHPRAVDGFSFQVPLLIALLREAARAFADPAAPLAQREMPFGDRPVFATGPLDSPYTFGEAESLEMKLTAFIREAGTGCTAILNRVQRDQLQRTWSYKLIDPLVADDLVELLHKSSGLQDGLRRVAGAPHRCEIERLTNLMRDLDRKVRFQDAHEVAGWLRPHLEKFATTYRLPFLLQIGTSLLHRGDFMEAKPYLDEAEVLVKADEAGLGADEKIEAAVQISTCRFDHGEFEEGLDVLEQFGKQVPDSSIQSRVKHWAARSALLRCAELWDEAVGAGERAISLAEAGCASQASRSLNYAAHALIRRAANRAEQREADLQKATELLRKSVVEWAPDEPGLHEKNLLFCEHLMAELERLRGNRYFIHFPGQAGGVWEHPRLFTLLSCARNRAHTREERIGYAQQLADAIKERRTKLDLFGLFAQLYACYLGALKGEPMEPYRDQIRGWCEKADSAGSGAWRKRLERYLGDGEIAEPDEWIERLLDAIPYH